MTTGAKMASRLPVELLTPERGATLFEDDLDSELLKWQPGDIKSFLALDFGDDALPSNAQNEFSVSKLDMDIDFDAGLRKLLSFDIHMPCCDGSPPPKRKAAQRSTSLSKQESVQPESDTDLLFADKPRQTGTSEISKEFHVQSPLMEKIVPEATNASLEKQEKAARCAGLGVPRKNADVSLGPEQDEVVNADDPQYVTHEVGVDEEGSARRTNCHTTNFLMLPDLSQRRIDLSMDVDSPPGQTAEYGSRDHPERISGLRLAKPGIAAAEFEAVCQPTSEDPAGRCVHAITKTASSKLVRSKFAAEFSLPHPKVLTTQSSKAPGIEVKKPVGYASSISPEVEVQGPKCALKLVSLQTDDAKAHKQSVAPDSVTVGSNQQLQKIGSSPTARATNKFPLGQKDAGVEISRGKRKLSPVATSAKKPFLETRVAVPIPRKNALEHKKPAHLHRLELRPVHQEVDAKLRLKQTRNSKVCTPKLLGPQLLPQQLPRFTELTPIPGTKAEYEDMPIKRDVDPSRSHRGGNPQEQGHRNQLPRSPIPALDADTVANRLHDLPGIELESMFTESSQLAAKLAEGLKHMKKIIKSKHEEVSDLLVRACILNTAWALIKNPMNELKISFLTG